MPKARKATVPTEVMTKTPESVLRKLSLEGKNKKQESSEKADSSSDEDSIDESLLDEEEVAKLGVL